MPERRYAGIEGVAERARVSVMQARSFDRRMRPLRTAAAPKRGARRGEPAYVTTGRFSRKPRSVCRSRNAPAVGEHTPEPLTAAGEITRYGSAAGVSMERDPLSGIPADGGPEVRTVPPHSEPASVSIPSSPIHRGRASAARLPTYRARFGLRRTAPPGRRVRAAEGRREARGRCRCFSVPTSRFTRFQRNGSNGLGAHVEAGGTGMTTPGSDTERSAP